MRYLDKWMSNSWLQHFLSSITTFTRLGELPGLAPLNSKEVLFSYIALYLVLWIGVRATSTIVYSFGGRYFSTSSFNIHRIYGLRNFCRSLTWFTSVSSPQFSTKASLDSNVPESENFKRDQSSSVEFCNAVPVSRRQKYLGTNIDYHKAKIWRYWGGVALSKMRTFHLQHELEIITFKM